MAYFAGLESKPKLSKLQSLVKPHLAKRWEELGTALGLADEDGGEQLDRIREQERREWDVLQRHYEAVATFCTVAPADLGCTH